MSTALIVRPRLVTVRYQDGATELVDLPRDTMDPRYTQCRAGQHRTACICREAEHAESIGEWRGEMKLLGEVTQRVLAGHLTVVGYEGGRSVGCDCTGCQIAREAYIPGVPSYDTRDIDPSGALFRFARFPWPPYRSDPVPF